METPKTLPLLLGLADYSDKIIADILSGNLDTAHTLDKLGSICKVKVKFKQAVDLWVKKRKRSYTEHVFSDFFIHNDTLCYKFKKGGRRGCLMPSLDLIESYEPVIESLDKFKSYEDFKSRFDTLFITEAEIKRLWEGTSAQHGNKYIPSDFRALGKQGRALMRQFLNCFKGITSDSIECYHTNSYGTSLNVHYNTRAKPGRDLEISHKKGLEFVHYSSEYAGCSNGSYGLIANRYTYLHLEDD